MTIRISKSTVILAVGVIMLAVGTGALAVALFTGNSAPSPEPEPATTSQTSQSDLVADQAEGVAAFVEYCQANRPGGGPIECDPFYAWNDQNYTSLATDYPGPIPQSYILEATRKREMMDEATTPTKSPTDPIPADEQTGLTKPGERVEPGTAKCQPGYVVLGNEESEGCFPQ